MFDIPFKMNGQTITVIDFSTKMIYFIYVTGFYIFSFGIYKFRQLIEFFRKKIIFESENSKLLNQIGWCFLIASVLFGAAGFLYSFIKGNNYDIVLSNGFGSVLFTCSIGLFFMVLSEIFKIAKK